MKVSQQAISASKPSKNSLGCLPVIGGAFLLIGLPLFYFFTIHPLMLTISAMQWQETRATITKSEVEVDRDSEGTTYKPDIQFEYMADKQIRLSKTWSTGFPGSNSQSRAKAVVEKYPVGSMHPCFYNPADPSRAVLDRSYQLSNLLGAFALVFPGAGAAMVWYYFRLRRNERRHAPPIQAAQKMGAGVTESGSVSVNRPLDTSLTAPWLKLFGPQKLRPAHGRITTFLATLALALFWNGISWTGFYNAWQDGIKIAIALLSLFVVVGFILIIVCLYNFLKLFNPIVVVAVSNGAPSPGETLDLAWETTGLVRIIRELKLSIIGEEVVTYVRGTTTTTERKVFQRLPVAAANTDPEIRFGSVSIDLPPDLVHSFEANNNKIVWSVEVHGVIAWWPDILEPMPFAIRPITVPDQQQVP